MLPTKVGRSILLLVASAQFSLVAQVTTATFYGIVTDPSGAVVANAEAVLTNEGT
jgi:hypothetical protein